MPLPVNWDSKARKNYTYKLDAVGSDTWRSHADAVVQNQKWVGDCDDLASTTLDLMVRNGADPKNLYRALVASNPRTGAVDHFVGIAYDEPTKKYYVVGDTFGPAYDLKNMKHKLVQVSPISEGIGWKNMTKEQLLALPRK